MPHDDGGMIPSDAPRLQRPRIVRRRRLEQEHRQLLGLRIADRRIEPTVHDHTPSRPGSDLVGFVRRDRGQPHRRQSFTKANGGVGVLVTF